MADNANVYKLYIEIPTNRVSVFKTGLVYICAVPTADVVTTEKINCYNFLIRLHSQDFRRRSTSGTTPGLRGWALFSVNLQEKKARGAKVSPSRGSFDNLGLLLTRRYDTCYVMTGSSQ